MATTANSPGILVTIRNPHETIPLTPETARALGVEAARDSSGLLAAIYKVDDETEIQTIRATGLICERVKPGAT